MNRVVTQLAVILALTCASGLAWAQEAPKPAGALGDLTTIDAANGVLTIKTSSGAAQRAVLSKATDFLLVEPGKKSLEGAEKITLADLKVGDRVEFARLTPWGFRSQNAELRLGFLVDSFFGILSQPARLKTDERLDTWDVVDQRLTRRLATPEDLGSLPEDGSWAEVDQKVRE